VPEKFQSQICFTRRPFFVHDLRGESAPLVNHGLFVGKGGGPKICEAIGAQDKETIVGVRAKRPMRNFRFGSDIRWGDIPIKKFVPRGSVAISREDVVQYFTSEL